MVFQNAKSFGEEPTKIVLTDGINTIVGENNVGKSNVLSLIRNLKDNLLEHYAFGESDWHEGNIDSPLQIVLRVSLDDEDVKYLLRNLDLPLEAVDEFRRSFGSEIIVPILYARMREGPSGVIRIGNVYVYGNTGSVFPIDIKAGYSMTEWRHIAKHYRESKTSILDMLKEELKERPTHRVDFHKNFHHVIGQLFDEKMIIFPEFRERPQKTASEALSSPSGREVAAVLFNLKNGTRKERDRFHRIQKDFSQLFPTLKLDVTKKGPEIVIERVLTGHELPLDFVGAGIAEMLILLTHIVASENRVILIDEPELHLHPHSQRLLYEVLKDSSKRNQLIVVTHSPLFVSMGNISGFILLREQRGDSITIQLSPDHFSKNDISRLERIVRSEDKEFFFSRGVMLVEGETEYGAMPVFSKKIDKSFDKGGVSIVCAGGYHFGMFIRLFRGFDFPYLIICDKDVATRISGTIQLDNVKYNTSSLFYQLHQLNLLDNEDLKTLQEIEGKVTEKSIAGKATKQYSEEIFEQIRKTAIKHKFFVLSSTFEGVISDAGYDDLLTESKKHFRKSKVLQGKYVAEKAESVPEEIRGAINLLYDEITKRKSS